jgi:hypothetical protein
MSIGLFKKTTNFTSASVSAQNLSRGLDQSGAEDAISQRRNVRPWNLGMAASCYHNKNGPRWFFKHAACRILMRST